MSKRNFSIADLLFILQVVLATIACTSQLLHILQEGSEGVSLVMFISVEIFSVINFALAIQAHKVQPSRVTRQTIFVYGLWITLWGANMLVSLYQLLITKVIYWDVIETITLIVLIVSLILVRIVSRVRGLSFRDPIVRGFDALVFKSSPQLFQALKFALFGGAGMSGLFVLLGNLTICIRLMHLYYLVREGKWDRNRKGMAISEIGNELSWLLASIVWLWWWLS